MAGALLYLDSSAIVKLVVHEPETTALRRLIRAWPYRVSSVLARVEVVRAARRIGKAPSRRAHDILGRISLIDVDGQVLEMAATLDPPHVRTLDAIHLATALSLRDELGAMCAYDSRLARAAGAADVEILAPG